MNNNHTITKMNSQDIPQVSELLCKCYHWLGEVEGFDKSAIDFLVNKRGSVETVTKEAQDEIYLIAKLDQHIVGVVSIKDNQITKLYVDPEYHRRGIGRELFNRAAKIILETGHSKISLGALGQSPLPFYQSMGLTVTRTKSVKLGDMAGVEITLMQKLIR